MLRREVITLIGGAGAAWPLTVRAQQKAMPVIGFISSTAPEPYADRVAAFRRGLDEAGFAEGRNVAIEYRWAEGDYARLPAMAAELVDRRANVIVAITTPAALAAKAATATIPVVFEMGTDPVEVGLVASLSHPGGNLTGVSLLNVELAPKRLELLHELVPAPVIGLLVNPNNKNVEIILRETEAAARTIGLTLYIFHAAAERDFDPVLGEIAERRIGGLVVGSDPFFNTRASSLPGCFFAAPSPRRTSIASLRRPAG